MSNRKRQWNIGIILTVSAILLAISIVASWGTLVSSAIEVNYWMNLNRTNITDCSRNPGIFSAAGIVFMVNSNVAWIFSLYLFVFICIESFYIIDFWKKQGTQQAVKYQPTTYPENQDEQERLVIRD